MAPLDGQKAPPVIRAAAIGPAAVAIARRAGEGLGVDRPFVGAAREPAARGHRCKVLRWRNQAHALELGRTGDPPGLRLADRHARKIRRVLVFEIQAAGDLRGAARSEIGASAALYPSSEFPVVLTAHHQPGLVIGGRRLDDQKHGGGEGRELVSGEVVELDEPHAGPARPDREIETVGGRGIEQGRDPPRRCRRYEPHRASPHSRFVAADRRAIAGSCAASAAAGGGRRCRSRSRESVRRRHWRRCRASCVPPRAAYRCRSLPCCFAPVFRQGCCNLGVIRQERRDMARMISISRHPPA